jgi:hypothetical protein
VTREKNTKRARARKATRNSVFLALRDAGGPARRDALWWVQAIAPDLVDLGSPVQRDAYDMICDGMRALLADEDAVSRVKRYGALRRRLCDAESPALQILDIADAVEIAVHLRRKQDDHHYAKIAPNAVKSLRAGLVERWGEGIPSEEDLEDWIDRHAEKRARGMLTTAGIVARIVFRGRLLGARLKGSAEDSERRTLSRVDRILSFHRRDRVTHTAC